ncbi:sensor histidine kinase [Haloglycomyces albus]|uniref:sensor histidine kinase n=1 Tax=Haloglycomyces albus TaxID=526067 RepID=UPI0004B4EEC6|nr:sensor histidine kinase [Haloglycomyces albus]
MDREAETEGGNPMTQRQWVATAMHAGFFLLLTASALRLLIRHEFSGRLTMTSLVVAGVLAVAYAVGVAAGDRLQQVRVPWLGAVLVLSVVLIVLAPSFAWCAIPLYFLCLETLPRHLTVAAAVGLTAAVIVGQLRIATVLEPSLVLAPIAIAGMMTAVLWALHDGIARRQELIDRLLASQDSLAQSQAERAVLEERQRLAGEIHDTLAQGLSSIGLLLQAAERNESAAERDVLLRQAAEMAEENLTEARRFVSGLGPSQLRDRSLGEALRDLSASFAHRFSLEVSFREDGARVDLPERASAALLRVVQGALANVVEHAEASRAAVTVSYMDEAVYVDVYDNGRGAAGRTAEPRRGTAHRGFGIDTMRRRMEDLGGTLRVESPPGGGTVVGAEYRRTNEGET